MPFKINISEKNGKTYKLESEAQALVGSSISDTIQGNLIQPELQGYEFQIMGGSDFAGFPLSKNAEGIGLKKVLLTKGWGMHNSQKGLRLRKTVRGKKISESTMQINLTIKKEGSKPLSAIFPEQNKPKEEVSKEQVNLEKQEITQEKN